DTHDISRVRPPSLPSIAPRRGKNFSASRSPKSTLDRAARPALPRVADPGRVAGIGLASTSERPPGIPPCAGRVVTGGTMEDFKTRLGPIAGAAMLVLAAESAQASLVPVSPENFSGTGL